MQLYCFMYKGKTFCGKIEFHLPRHFKEVYRVQFDAILTHVLRSAKKCNTDICTLLCGLCNPLLHLSTTPRVSNAAQCFIMPDLCSFQITLLLN